MVKIKTILSTLKEKKRYVLYEIESKRKMNNQQVIQEGLKNFIGDLGLAKAGLQFIKSKNNRGIFQVTNKSLNEVRTGLALIQDSENPIRIKTLKVSGMINKLKL